MLSTENIVQKYHYTVAPVRMQQLGKRQADRCIAPSIREMRQSILVSHTTQLSYLLPYLKYMVLLVPTIHYLLCKTTPFRRANRAIIPGNTVHELAGFSLFL